MTAFSVPFFMALMLSGIGEDSIALGYQSSENYRSSSLDVQLSDAQPLARHDVREALDQFTRTNGGRVEVEWNHSLRTPTLLRGKLTAPSNHSPGWIAAGVLSRLKTVYGLNHPHDELKIIEVRNTLGGASHIRVQHVLFGTPVYGDELIVHIDKQGVVRQVRGAIHPELHKQLFNRPLFAVLSEKQALAAATAALGAPLEAAAQREVTMQYMPTRKGIPLVYVIQFHYSRPTPQTRTVIVHALTGNVISE
ncbi:PepSY domain-containing protein [Paenibacillus xerothermodurans]|uniref:FTP domain-containing protein n=1 Tax=Paenibacillus xerothermodurans TaxID=1977292 RepID=A0A2W1N6W7_PAEXE|nr:PepSY domain-containing protein [Paenibacillus xerothermodurans]PZE19554.1 hypothetical protein CBW46_017695 [Paenibacillus xerothermodurans]